jgi:cobaltochelatase CobN
MLTRRLPLIDRCAHMARLAVNWAKLRKTPPEERRIAILFHQYPPKNDRLGAAYGLDSFASVKHICDRLAAEGYMLETNYSDGDSLAFELLDRLTNDRRYLPPERLRERAFDTIQRETSADWHAQRPQRIRRDLEEKWGPSPGVTFVHEGEILIGGLVNGNVFIGMQPSRARMEDGDLPKIRLDGSAIHDPYLPPTHHYLTFYRWLREVFKAQAVVHIGTHGTLEWLPGKSVGLSEACHPEAAISDLPNLYPYIVSDPGEGTLAKRRSNACILDHMIPAQTNAGKSDPLEGINELVDKVYWARQEDPAKVSLLIDLLRGKTEALHLDRDIGLSRSEAEADPEEYCRKLHGYLNEVDVTSINDGLHIFGCPMTAAQINETSLHLTRLPNGDIPSLWDAVATARGFDPSELRDDSGDLVAGLNKTKGQVLSDVLSDLRTALDELDDAGWTEQAIVAVTAQRFAGSLRVEAVLRFIRDVLRPALFGVTDEIDYTVKGLAGKFVPAGASGAPTRGNIDVLPTGRNFYTVDPFKIPSPEAWAVRVKLGDALVEGYRVDEDRDPQQLGIILWATATMRTRGDDVAEILYFMGARPVWDNYGRVLGVEVIPLKERKFPRLDVTVRAGGLVRDTLPTIITLIDDAVRMLAALEEPPESNILRRNVSVDRDELIKAGLSPEEADRRASFRVFAAKPGCYGAGCQSALKFDPRSASKIDPPLQVTCTDDSARPGGAGRGCAAGASAVR